MGEEANFPDKVTIPNIEEYPSNQKFWQKDLGLQGFFLALNFPQSGFLAVKQLNIAASKSCFFRGLAQTMKVFTKPFLISKYLLPFLINRFQPGCNA